MSELRRVGLNLLYLIPGETGGMETYARQLIQRLGALGDLELVAFVNREGAAELSSDELGGAEIVPVDVSAGGRFGRVLAEERRLPRLVREHGIELLHSLGSSAPRRLDCVSVVTIHDLIYKRFPEAHTRLMRLGMSVLVPRAARGADRVITVSEASAADLTSFLGIPAERIDVIAEAGRPIGPATPEGELRSRLDLGSAPIVLSVSARRPHKNIARLLEAFALLEADPSPLLVLPGYSTTFEGELEARARELGIADRVRFLGWVPNPDLEGLYGAATLFVFPSLAEGFGLPVLEAMERGVAVACSRTSALPEVAGDAARYFEPTEVAEIAAAISELIADAELRGRLGTAGRERAASFSWERAARETRASYERAWALYPPRAAMTDRA